MKTKRPQAVGQRHTDSEVNSPSSSLEFLLCTKGRSNSEYCTNLLIKKSINTSITGQCWSDDSGNMNYDVNGLSTEGCVDQCTEPCKKHSKFCAGQSFANYVYKLSKPMLALLDSHLSVVS